LMGKPIFSAIKILTIVTYRELFDTQPHLRHKRPAVLAYGIIRRECDQAAIIAPAQSLGLYNHLFHRLNFLATSTAPHTI